MDVRRQPRTRLLPPGLGCRPARPQQARGYESERAPGSAATWASAGRSCAATTGVGDRRHPFCLSLRMRRRDGKLLTPGYAHVVEFRFQSRPPIRFFRFRDWFDVAVAIECNCRDLQNDGDRDPRLPVRESPAGDDKFPGPANVCSEAPGSEDKSSENGRLQEHRDSGRQTPNLGLPLLHSPALTKTYSGAHFGRI